MLQKLRGNSKGFTLIELMIVIAIIGILAAIAIPNFISYRDKSFCSRAETDAGNVAATLADYFAIPTHVVVPPATSQKGRSPQRLSSAPIPASNVPVDRRTANAPPMMNTKKMI